MTMRSPALAIGYGIWCRNGKGYLLSAAGLAAMAVVYPALFAQSKAAWVMAASTIPLIGIFGFVLNAAIFADEPGSLSSSYPRHMLVLPVKSGTLVFWPILYGSSIAACLWVVTAGLVYRSSGLAIPIGLPALVLVVVTSWFQALAWLPLAVRWLRLVITIFSTLALGFVPLWIIRSDPAATTLVVLLLLGYLPPAWFLALAAVRADRRGDTWRLWFFGSGSEVRAGRLARARVLRPFRSAPSAQLWYEWRCHGLVIVSMLGVMMIQIWFFLTYSRPVHSSRLPLILGLLIMAPIAVVGSVGPAVSRFRPLGVDDRKFITFLATRPIASGAIVAAKFRMALVSILLSWAFILAGTAGCIVYAFGPRATITAWQQVAAVYPGGRALAILVITCTLIPVLMWRQLTDGLPFVLTGRPWIALCSVWVYCGFLIGLISGGLWLANHPEQLPRVLSLAPWLAGFAAVVKAVAAVLSFRLALRRRLMGWPAFWTVLAMWLTLTALAIGLAILILPQSGVVSRPSLYLGIATFVPLTRFPLATLALDWNRRR